MEFRPSQWLPLIITNGVSQLKAWFPALKAWAYYGFRRSLLLCTLKYGMDTLWLCMKKRRLGVTFARELSLMSWVPKSLHYAWDPVMRIFIRKCGYQYSPAGVGFGKSVQPWFYGDIKDNTQKILERMEEKALKRERYEKFGQAEEMKAISRTLRNFGEFNMEEIMMFFKASTPMHMEKGTVIFGPDDTEEYFYAVVVGEIHLFCEGLGNRGVEVLKVAGSDCIVSLLSFLNYFAVGPQKFGDLKLHAVCDVPGKYYRVPMLEMKKYIESDKEKMYNILSSILVRHYKFMIGLSDLAGILPRLMKQSYLDASYDPIDLEPGLLTDKGLIHEAFEGFQTVFPLKEEDRRLCWVGVLNSRTILLPRYKKAKYAFYIHRGLVACTVSKLRRSYNTIQFYVSDGQVIGMREAIVGTDVPVQFQVADEAKAFVVAIPDFLLKKYFKEDPLTGLGVVKKLLDRLSLLCRQVDYALRYTHKRVNEVVYHKMDEFDSKAEVPAYFCLSGRLRFIAQDNPQPDEPVQYGIIEVGDWFGLVAMYTDHPSMHRTIICDRCSEYVVVPRHLISAITAAFREAAGHQCDYMARTIHRGDSQFIIRKHALDTDKMADSRFQVDFVGAHTWRTYRMVCIYPASEAIPGEIYCHELARHHTSSAGVITREDAVKALGVSKFTIDGEFTLAKWLVQQEEKHTVIFVLATNDFSDLWNETVAKLSDMIQVVITYQIPYTPSKNETQILEMAVKARKELVFLHPVIRVTKPQLGPTKYPSLPHGSILWLRPRPWVQRHHHVRMLDSALRYMTEKNPADLEKYNRESKDPDKHSDFGRVMRWISGQSVGIVLGGGGAKGAAHLGALHYLLELDVPVDYIGGVSIGSFLGALYAVYENIHVVEKKAKELWEELKNPFRYARDLPFHPFSAAFRGHAFNCLILYFFGSIQMEDLYIPYFCVTTDLNDNCARTHMSGDLWFYVRASMTLTLVFPPQINQFDYHLLMDGGYSDLVPAMTMRRLGIKYLFAINIGDERSLKTFNIGYHVSGLKCILQNLLPNSIDSIPDYFSFWDALLYCSARNFIQILKAMDEYCIYIRPNINAYTGLDFQNYEELKTAGYLSTKFKFGGLRMKNLPVHVIWYLVRFYTYPTIAMSQTQLLQGFTDEDWEFAVDLMSKTQMFQRAKNIFLRMNLTPYLTDVMEARTYLESIIKDKKVKNVNLHVAVLENFSREDERLDLVHAIGRMKELTYMEEFEDIVKQSQKSRYEAPSKMFLEVAQSQVDDLINVRGKQGYETRGVAPYPEGVTISARVKGTFSIKDLFKADPTLFHAVASYHHLQVRNKTSNNDDDNRETHLVKIASKPDAPLRHSRSRQGGRSYQSLPSLHSLIHGLGRAKSRPARAGKPAEKGQRLAEFRKCFTKADRKKASQDEKMTPIVTLKQLRRSFATKGITQL